MTRPVRHAAASALAACLAVVLAVVPAAAYGPTRTVRTSESTLFPEGLAARGSDVGATWQESGGDGAVWFRISRNNGATWSARERISPFPTLGGSAAICMGRLWVATLLTPEGRDPGEYEVAVDGIALGGAGRSSQLVTLLGAGGSAASSAIACVGNRFLALAWVERAPGDSPRAKLRVWDPAELLGMGEPAGGGAVTRDLGSASAGVHIAVAAKNTAVAVTWSGGANLRYRTYPVAAGSTVSLGAPLDRTIASGVSEASVVAMESARVIVAYRRGTDVYTRLSVNGGSSFATAVRVVDGDAGIGQSAVPESIAIAGSRVLLHVTQSTTSGYRQWRLESTNGGASYSDDMVGSSGVRRGAFAGTASAPRAAELWDLRPGYGETKKLLFHVES